jgi:hypothetical protein
VYWANTEEKTGTLQNSISDIFKLKTTYDSILILVMYSTPFGFVITMKRIGLTKMCQFEKYSKF